MKTCECGREYHRRQGWIHEPGCRYLAGLEGRPEVYPNHVKVERRGYYRGDPVTRAVTTVTAEDPPVTETVTEEGVAVTRVLSNAERQRRWREKRGGSKEPQRGGVGVAST